MPMYRAAVVASCCAAHAAAAAGTAPPPMPLTFSANTTESYSNWPLPGQHSVGQGRWVYDWPSRRAVFSHAASADSVFCAANDPSGQQPCRLIFTPGGVLWSEFGNGTCCAVCNGTEGCSMLLPNWTATATTRTPLEVEGVACEGWGEPGSAAGEDVMYFDGGRICQYAEVFGAGGATVHHNITFRRGTWTPSADPAELAPPAACRRRCPSDPFAPSQVAYICNAQKQCIAVALGTPGSYATLQQCQQQCS